MGRMRSRLPQKSRELSDKEYDALVRSHLLHGYGHELFFSEYGDAADELTPARLAKEWPRFREELMAMERFAGTRPVGWWVSECPEPQRSEYIAALKAERRYRRADSQRLPLPGTRAEPQRHGRDEPAPDEDFNDLQARLLEEAGLLEPE